jgi:hypothetical protein
MKPTNLATLIAIILLPVTLQAAPVYRYEFARAGDTARLQGAEGTAYLDFHFSSGSFVPLDQAIADIQFRGWHQPGSLGVRPGLPDIPAPIFHGLYGLQIWNNGGISWGEDLGVLGTWIIRANAWPEGTNFRLDSANIYSFYPALDYWFNESTFSGSFHFAGIVDNPHVPDAGSTLLLLALTLCGITYAHSRKQPA